MKKILSKTDGSVIRVRVKQAQRDQIQWRDASLDQLVPKDHRVRAVWAYVDSLDLTALYEKIRAVERASGGTRSIRRFCWRCGCLPPLKRSAVLGM